MNFFFTTDHSSEEDVVFGPEVVAKYVEPSEFTRMAEAAKGRAAERVAFIRNIP